MADPAITRYKRRHSTLKTEREPWLKVMRTLSDWVVLRRGRYLTSDRNKPIFNNRIINDTATWANGVFAAGMTSGVTSPASPWFRLGTVDPSLARFGRVKEWLRQVEIVLRGIYSRSNFYTAAQQLYVDEGGFGWGTMTFDRHPTNTIHCHVHPAGSTCLAIDHFGVTNTMYREDRWSVSQVVARFGKENVSQRVLHAWNRQDFDQWVDIVHVIEPRGIRDANQPDQLNMPWRSVYYEATESEKLLSVGGFLRMPGVGPRWDVNGNDVYATGPGHRVLGATKGLQVQEQSQAKGIEKMADPTMTGPASMRTTPSTTLPGGMTYEPVTGGGQGYRPAYQVNPRIGELTENIRVVEQRIGRAYMTDMFLMMINDPRRQPPTATEVVERHEEKLLMVGPALVRQNHEFLDPAIDIAFDAALDDELLPPPPMELEGQPLSVQYISILHQAQRMVGTANIDRYTGYVQNLAATHPDALTKLDPIEAADAYGEMLGVPPKLVVPNEEARRLVAEGRRREAQQAMMDQAAGTAAIAGELGKTPSTRGEEGGSLLEDIAGAAAA